MRTNLRPSETAGVIAGAAVFLAGLIAGGWMLVDRRRRVAPLPARLPEAEPVEMTISSHINEIQMARELAYQKAVTELEDFFENECKTPEDAAYVKKTLDFLSATLTAIG